ncbi:hypothetical protein KL930_000999 [Ogataea haglerorum]|uniref:Adenylate cyclase n=1 Tax=Ogataea haglerorum TaxID=1937702 RepID=A0AAN6DAM0_9ASCO|nr:hypothetical protein KL915_001000 [Ogataea haglerorum]KAG7730546.1 hypothetical protein KL933_000341 [Ogataea haglerorum]KAG7734858.1 hypothetical protein KL948_000424 [Ogataea haglerorum]KAG7769056.1 hypothetical protein KL946_000339 [Ogataea haglerorum]KAG7781197.1 hypothetical protein KL922_000119 [Ogataea haglerorum]
MTGIANKQQILEHDSDFPTNHSIPQFNSKYTAETFGASEALASSAQRKNKSQESSPLASPTTSRRSSRFPSVNPVSPSSSSLALSQDAHAAAHAAPVHEPRDNGSRRPSSSHGAIGVPKSYKGFHGRRDGSEKPVPPLMTPIKPKKSRRGASFFNKFLPSRRDSDPKARRQGSSHSSRFSRRSDQSLSSRAGSTDSEKGGSPRESVSFSSRLKNPLSQGLPFGGSEKKAAPFNLDLDTDNEHMAEITRLSNSRLSRMGSTASMIPQPPLERTDWRPPESWKVKNTRENSDPLAHYPGIQERSSSVSSASSTTSSGRSLVPPRKASAITSPSTSSPRSDSNVDGSREKRDSKSTITEETGRVYHAKELKGASRSSVRIFIGDKSSVLPCTLDTTCKDVLDSLHRKRFLKNDEDHIIVLKCGGLIRTLSLDERPLKIQRTMLFLYGYTQRDNLDYIERTDLSFLFKFVVQDRGVELISNERRRMINPQNVDLNNWNLQDIPNFLYAEPIVSLDVSQNPSFEFTKEFMHDCRNLLHLSFTRSGNPKFPTPVVYAPRLQELNLEVNYIKLIPPEISKMTTLTTLNLACNRISTLPASFAELQSLQSLNLSSNRLKNIPEPLTKIAGLKRLDLSYNSISEIPDSVANLANLEVLQLAANKLSRDLPPFFRQLKTLIKIDIRFNKFDSIDALKNLPALEVIRATGNNISVFKSSAANLFEVELNINPVTLVKFDQVMTKLKIVDFSKDKLTSCSFVSMLPAIEKLTMDYNHLVSLPDDIYKMKNLTHLSVFRNNLTSLPTAIGSLTKLRYLDLHLNNISLLTPEIWNLSSLEYFNISSNLLEFFPDPPEQFVPFTGFSSLGRTATQRARNHQSSIVAPASKRRTSEISTMTINNSDNVGLEKSLKVLSLNDNKFTDSVIQTVSMFKNLVVLNLSYNELFDIPPGHLNNLTKLQKLYLSGNHLSSLPVDDLEAFTKMDTLHLNGNRFHTLPAELSKITNMTALDVGSNNLKYNIGNIPYDWNWSYNPKLMYLNFSGNKRLEIKPLHKREGMEDSLDSFLVLKDLKLLGLMDVTITTDLVPDQSVDVRVRSTASQLGKYGYGISDTLGNKSSLTTRDVVIERFRGNSDEKLITIYDGKNCSDESGDKISKIIQETFEIHLAKELEGQDSGKTIEDALRAAFLTMNSEMSILINKDNSSTFSSAAAHRTTTTDELTMEKDGLTGCCATVIYIRGDELYVANIGDIMGILTKADGEYSVLTIKHEPYAPEEYARIRESGGFVTTDGYLDGVSDVSRAVGYFKLIPHINAVPSISKYKLTQNEEMIAIATSEIWKKVPYDLAADIVRQEKSNPGIAAEKLRDFAISYGVSDKATAVVLSLQQFTTKQKYHERGSLPEDSLLRKLDEEIEPPTGELAMVFTDIKNSTLLWDTYPVAMRSAIKVHNAIMRRQLRIIGGYEVKTEGDAFMVSFPTPSSALLWCFTVQSQLLTTDDWPAEILASDQGCEIKDEEGNIIFRGLSVRMGVHWGRPVCERDIVTKRMDYFGPMVNRASRVSSVADGGQIAMSTDFYYEFEKLRNLHEQVKSGAGDISQVYGSKTLGQILESQMNQVDQIGWVEESIGSRKLKGLEAPEKIWLIFPAHLAQRLKLLTRTNGEIDNRAGKLLMGGLTAEGVWKLRKLSLRLEKICSFCAGSTTQLISNKSQILPSDLISSSAEETFINQIANAEMDLLLLIEHVVTRIENAVGILTVRKYASPDEANGLLMGSMDELYRTMRVLVHHAEDTARAKSQRMEELPEESSQDGAEHVN